MASKFGGGGTKCTICDKTAYPAETISFEKKPYHIDCFRCQEATDGGGVCNKKMEGAAKASAYEGKIYCKQCFTRGGYTQKQRNVKWKKKEGSATSAVASKFGGGGSNCKVCQKTVYPAEALSYEKEVYHQACFVCTHDKLGDGVACGKKMTSSGAANFDDKLYCTQCFETGGYRQKQSKIKKSTSSSSNAMASKFGGGGNKCEVCAKTVYQAETVSYEKKAYHPQCFVCVHVRECGTKCSKKLTPSSAKILEGSLYCSQCWEVGGYRQQQSKLKVGAPASAGTAKPADSRFAGFGGGGNKCKKCEKTVYPAETLSFEKECFHQACFTCQKCDKKLTPSSAEGKKKDGKLESWHCKSCFQELGLHRA